MNKNNPSVMTRRDATIIILVLRLIFLVFVGINLYCECTIEYIPGMLGYLPEWRVWAEWISFFVFLAIGLNLRFKYLRCPQCKRPVWIIWRFFAKECTCKRCKTKIDSKKYLYK